MRTVPAADILSGVAAKAGLDITDGGLAALQRPTILPWLENLGDYLREAWDAWPWPDLITVEQRYFFEGKWATGTTVPAGRTVYHDGAYWTAKSATPTAPVTGANWEPLDPAARVYHLPLAPLFGEPMGTIHGISEEDLRLLGGHARPVQFVFTTGLGCHVPARHGPVVWVRYKAPCPEFRAFVANQNWAKGEGAYSASTGKFYRAATALTNSGSLSGGWTEYHFPAIFRRYLIHKVFAQWLRSEKRLDEGAIASHQADNALDTEIRRYLDQGQDQPVRYKST
jgi:hypothetical protein